MNEYRYTPGVRQNIFGGQRNMARIEVKKGNFRGKFALTGWAFIRQFMHHAMLSLGCCVFIAKC
jgi:hypothetical protein